MLSRLAGALTTVSFVLASTTAFAAGPTTIVGTVDNSSAIASCSLVVSPDTPGLLTPVVVLQPPLPAAATDVRFSFYDSLGKVVGSQIVTVQAPPATGLPPVLASFTQAVPYSTMRCDTKPGPAPVTAPAAGGAAAAGGGAGTGILLGVLGGGALLALAVGHGGGGGSSSSSSPTLPPFVPTPTPVPTVAPTATATPTAVPTATATPTVKPTPTATAIPTVAPSGSPAAPTPTPTPTIAPTATPTPTMAPTASPTPTTGPTASPIPTNSPTPTAPPGAVTLTPSTLNFSAAGTAYNQSSTASQTNNATFSVSGMTCPSSVATISQSGSTFTVTPVGAGATCTFTISGANGMSAMLTVNVTTSSGTIMIRRHNVAPMPQPGPAPKR